MKRKRVFILLCVLGILYLQFGRKPILNNSTTSSNAAGYEAILTVTANKLGIESYDKLAKNIIQQTVNNDFENMQLSYDVLGYPNELTVTVYANNITKFLGAPVFQIRYTQETPYVYNIVENPEKFTLVYE